MSMHPSTSPSRLRVAVLGANGRMGRAVIRLAQEAGMKVVCAVGVGDVGRDAGELAGVGHLGVPVVSSISSIGTYGANVVVDFSAPQALVEACSVCAKAKVALVSGTTGLSDVARAALSDAAKQCAVMWEPNMSIGVHVLATLVKQAALTLGDDFDVEVVETHHRAKVDAPSGTAIRLGDVVRKARGSHFVHGREGRPGPRAQNEIGMHAVRGGDVVGDHTVFFFGAGERLELTHRASNRELFAHGALRAALWISGRAPGRYTLDDMVAVPA
ncbi:MAG: 4-hydroxy-tetrahydrodipicolinate reductase [Polyangiaceae bacterium]|nr:4-hydroxy-tetrahydrodipicolinate reductase [Polyangiaceae bacterium]